MAEEKIVDIPFQLETLNTKFLTPTILHVELNRPRSLNAMSKQMFAEIKQLFSYLTLIPCFVWLSLLDLARDSLPGWILRKLFRCSNSMKASIRLANHSKFIV